MTADAVVVNMDAAAGTGHPPGSNPEPDRPQGALLAAGQLTEKENLIKQSSLAQAKDRAQMTATTAMSIINVALLKAVIDQEPESNKYYYASLGLIIASLALQIIAGIVSLLVATIQSYYNKHSDDICEDISQMICFCRCRKHSRKRILNISQPKANGTGDLVTPERTPPPSGCCGCYATSRTFSEYEYDILDTYEQWLTNIVDFELTTLNAESRMKYLAEVVLELETQITNLKQEAVDNPPKEAELTAKIANLSADIKKRQLEITEFKKCRVNSDVARDQGSLLSQYVEGIRKSHVLKKVTFWQDCLIYLLYLVFILNAFITGLGLAVQPSNTDSIAVTTSSTLV